MKNEEKYNARSRESLGASNLEYLKHKITSSVENLSCTLTSLQSMTMKLEDVKNAVSKVEFTSLEQGLSSVTDRLTSLEMLTRPLHAFANKASEFNILQENATSNLEK